MEKKTKITVVVMVLIAVFENLILLIISCGWISPSRSELNDISCAVYPASIIGSL
ncbi:MAG: hypothetical protein ACLSA6_04975 [Holdemania massiliensis]